MATGGYILLFFLVEFYRAVERFILKLRYVTLSENSEIILSHNLTLTTATF